MLPQQHTTSTKLSDVGAFELGLYHTGWETTARMREGDDDSGH